MIDQAPLCHDRLMDSHVRCLCAAGHDGGHVSGPWHWPRLHSAEHAARKKIEEIHLAALLGITHHHERSCNGSFDEQVY